VLQVDGETENLDEAFASAMGFLRSRIAKDLTVRRMPELRFRLDETQATARNMDELIESAIKSDAAGKESDDSQN